MSILTDLRRFIRRHRLLPDRARVVVGVSGGPDSLALLHALNALSSEHHWRLHAAYLHHGLRDEADDEARFVANMAAEWGLGCTIERADVRGIAAQPGVSLEEAARQARYAFLGRVAKRLGARYVAVGHNADDQAETVIMHLLRGSGLAGLRGMTPDTPLAGLRLTALPADQRPDFHGIHLVRPWLQTSRDDIWAYCRRNQLEPRIDATNTDATFFRNRLRHEVLPLLRAINPRLTRTLGHTALALQGDYEVLSRHRDHLWDELARIEPHRIRFRLAAFRALPIGDQRALLRRAIATLRPHHRNIGWEHTERLLDLLVLHPQQASGGPYPLLAGVEAYLNHPYLDIISSSEFTMDLPQVQAPLTLPLPGSLSLGRGWSLRTRRCSWPAQAPPWHERANPNILWLPIDIPRPLIVRPRRPGDRIQPFGMSGAKPITALMTELRLPRAARAHWPLLVDGSGRILWLVGQRASEACRLPADATEAWEIVLSRRPGDV
ncbi:MAG: tRNA lysidine(34) synthetase TilS [Chloroflexi bacterium]|nr:tRNA lysidine(34) synthetase TilS [Chloroflexota bacterium]